MPRKRRPDQGPPLARIRAACAYCKVKRLKCSEDRPCNHCVTAGQGCVYIAPRKRRRTSSSIEESLLVHLDSPDTAQSCESLHLTTQDSRTAELDTGEEALQPATVSNNDCAGSQDFDLTDTALRQPCFSSSIDLLTADTDAWESFLANPIFLSRPRTPSTSNLLNMNPQYRELWYHYTEVLSCLHTSHEESTNPIVNVLSPVAQSSDALLAVLLACSLENYRSLRGLGPDEEALNTLISVAVTGVQSDLGNLQDTHVSDTTLATVIALCDFEVVARKRATTSSWRLHLDGAKHIISLRGGLNQGKDATELYRFLLKWLAYFDIMSSMTSTKAIPDPLFQGKYWLKTLGSSPVDDDEFKLDPYMSFLQDVVPYFKEIGSLSRLRHETASRMNLRDAHRLHTRCRTIESNLKESIGTITGHSWTSPKKLAVLIECHDAFVYSTLIHLYRRVEGIPSDMDDVRYALKYGLSHIAKSCEQDEADIDSSLLFPLFTFGCEACTHEEKQYILSRLTALGALGLGNVDRAIEVLLAVWDKNEISDRNTDWDEILKMFEWEVNLA